MALKNSLLLSENDANFAYRFRNWLVKAKSRLKNLKLNFAKKDFKYFKSKFPNVAFSISNKSETLQQNHLVSCTL